MNDISEKTAGFLQDLGQAARRNPLSAALIGMGALWLFSGGKAAARAGELLRSAGLDHAPEAARDTIKSVKSGVSSGAGVLRDTAVSSFDEVRERGAAALDATDFAERLPDPGTVLENVRGNLTELFKAEPLALGAIGLAVGAGIAAAFPATVVEDTYLGEVSDVVRSKTAEIAGQQIEKATTLATDIVDAATEEARKQGLTPEGARTAAGDIADRVSRVVDAARAGASERAG